MKKLTENGGVCADCKKNVGELYETLKERIRDKKLEKTGTGTGALGNDSRGNLRSRNDVFATFGKNPD